MGFNREYLKYLNYLKDHDPLEGFPISFDQWLMERGLRYQVNLTPVQVMRIGEGEGENDNIRPGKS